MRNVWEALSDYTRREILIILKKGPLSAGQIYEYFDITKPSLSHHLSVLKESGLVKCKKNGKNVIYYLKFIFIVYHFINNIILFRVYFYSLLL